MKRPAADIGLETREQLAVAAAAGDAAAARQLANAAYATAREIAAASRTLRAATDPADAAATVAAAVFAKLSAPSAFARYRIWRTRNASRTFDDWLRIVTTNAARDWARSVGLQTRTGDPSLKRVLNELAPLVAGEEPSARPPFTDAQTAREILEFAASRLDARDTAILRGWLAGDDLDALARTEGLRDEAEARRRLRAAIAVLRRRFADG